MRSTPARISPATYPIAATATAPAFEYPAEAQPVSEPASSPSAAGQQMLFQAPLADPRVIPFDSLTTHAERESIRARAAELARPAPLKTEKIAAPRPRARKTGSADQGRLDFTTPEASIPLPESSIVCDAPVAPVALRIQAAAIDALLMTLGCGFGAALWYFLGAQLWVDRRAAPFFLLSVFTVPLFYKLLWTVAGRDTAGMRSAGLQLVDFDGNRPSQTRRYQRLCATFLSLLAAGMGLIWALVDEDGLTWHDHISSTFPTLVSEE